MRIYTASRFSDYERVRAFNDQLRDRGHVISHDWTRTDEFDEHGVPKFAAEKDVPPDVARTYAEDDLKIGVGTADLVIFFADGSNYCGALIEFGTAVTLGIPVWVLAPWRPSIFWHLPHVRVMASADEALAGLDEFALGAAA